MEVGKITKYTGGSHGKDSARAYVKKLTRRKRRRLERTMLDDTPVRVTKGWAD